MASMQVIILSTHFPPYQIQGHAHLQEAKEEGNTLNLLWKMI